MTTTLSGAGGGWGPGRKEDKNAQEAGGPQDEKQPPGGQTLVQGGRPALRSQVLTGQPGLGLSEQGDGDGAGQHGVALRAIAGGRRCQPGPCVRSQNLGHEQNHPFCVLKQPVWAGVLQRSWKPGARPCQLSPGPAPWTGGKCSGLTAISQETAAPGQGLPCRSL